MSRIGRKEIIIPEGVQITERPGLVVVKKDELVLMVPLPNVIRLKQAGGRAALLRLDETKSARALHGLTRSLLSNAVEGVVKGFEKQLEIVGVGFRATLEENDLNLKIGLSHEVKVAAPEGIVFEVKKNIISIKGADKQLVGQTAAKIRDLKKPEPYKGKGIKYVGEKIIRKVGKAVKGAGA